MELRQLRYFIRVVELGSFDRAAADLQLVEPVLSQQITGLESELDARLLGRTAKGVSPTEAGMAFMREAQLTPRQAEQAVRVTHQAHLTGTVSIALPPTLTSALGIPLMNAMRERYPAVRLQPVESLSAHLAHQLNACQLDMAVLYRAHSARRWKVSQPQHAKECPVARSRGANRDRVRTVLLRPQVAKTPPYPGTMMANAAALRDFRFAKSRGLRNSIPPESGLI